VTSQLDLAPGRPSFNILRPAHVEFRVTDLARARDFYVRLLGFVESASDRDRLYLRGYEERDHHSLVLRRAASPGAGHLTYRVASEDDLDRLERLAERRDLPVRWVEEAHQGRTLRFQDPFGLPVEFVHEIEQAERLLQRYDLYRGAFVMRLDHFNCQLPDVAAAARWYQSELGFACSEYATAEDPSQLSAIWLHRKPNVHDLALMTGTGPRLHHAAYWVADQQSVLRACDILAAAGLPRHIERGPGRHGLGNAFFLYLRDPDGNRIELYTGDYMIADPDWKPIHWAFDDPRRATFWGIPAPASWFDEASRVESVVDGSFVETRAPLLPDRPVLAT
jgi:3,4-dihydroxyphenylacetate 2,3-dioxygenase